MALALFVFGGFLLIQENLQRTIAGWGSGLQVFAYVDAGLSAADIEALRGRVAGYAEVEAVRFVSQQQAWESFKKSLGSRSGVLDGVSADALPASLEIALKPAARTPDSIAAVARKLRAERGVVQVDYPEEWTEKLAQLLMSIEAAKWVFGGVLLIAALFIAGNAAKLAIAARRDEIEVLQLVGAGPGTVQAPFVIEGFTQGLAGAVVSLLLLWLSLRLASAELTELFGVFSLQQVRFFGPQICAMLVILGCAIGAAGSFFALRRQLLR
jgi:cell division transport system permease protein